MKKYKYKMNGLDCANCAQKLEEKLQKIKSIENVSISFMTERLTFECEEENKENVLKQIIETIKKEEPDIEILEI